MQAPERGLFPRLWLCADLDAIALEELLDRVGSVLHERACAIWVRSGPSTPARHTYEAAWRMVAMVRAHGGQVWVGDRVDVAIATGAHGVHFGSRGLGLRATRMLIQRSRPDDTNAPRFLSAAVHDRYDVREASKVADVLMLSPLGAVAGKAPPLGCAGFAATVAQAPSAFFVALGGITTPDDARIAARAGASAIAVRRALLESRDPAATCAELANAFEAALRT